MGQERELLAGGERQVPAPTPAHAQEQERQPQQPAQPAQEQQQQQQQPPQPMAPPPLPPPPTPPLPPPPSVAAVATATALLPTQQTQLLLPSQREAEGKRAATGAWPPPTTAGIWGPR